MVIVNNKRVEAHLAIILANIMFGVNYSIAKGVMPNYLSPMAFTLLRVINVLVLFWLISKLGTGNEKLVRLIPPYLLHRGYSGFLLISSFSLMV